LAADHHTDAGIVAAWQHNSSHRKGWALRAVRREVLASQPTARIAVWGVAYKQDTHSIKNSASVELMGALPQARIQAYDPVARIDPAKYPQVRLEENALQALDQADALVIMTPWKEFSGIPVSEIRARLAGRLVIDPYGMLDHRACVAAGLRHFQLGCA
jgi:UDPglucose 6-dehydrogenase